MKLRVISPCSEDWNAMEPRLEGRLCERCEHRVVDFTRMTRRQAEARLRAARGGKVCGRAVVNVENGVAVFRSDRPRAPRWTGGVVLAAALGAGCAAQEPEVALVVEPDTASLVSPPMLPIDEWIPEMPETPSLATRAVPVVELELPRDSASPTAEQQRLTAAKRALLHPPPPQHGVWMGDFAF